MKKYKKYILLLFLVITLPFFADKITFASSTSGGLEITYPSIPGLPNINQTNPGLGEYVGYFFGLLIYLAGILSLISFTIGAVGLINPNPEAHSDAKDRMFGAILGLVLTFASFIIIRTINPTLITPTLTPLQGVAGVFLINGAQQKPCPQESPDNSALPVGFRTIQYTCSNASLAPALLVWTFPNTNFGPIAGATVQRITCGGTMGVGGRSFRIAFEEPGVYYYLGTGCTGYASPANTSSQDSIESPFGGYIKSVKIVNSPNDDLYYGAVFHREAGLKNGGECSLPIISQAENRNGECMAIGASINTSAVDIFKLNKNPGASGDGVTFYSEPFGSAIGARAGFFPVPDSAIGFLYAANPQAMTFAWTNVAVPNQYKIACKTFQACPGSIKIKGSYLVGLYSKDSANLNYCQTFTTDAENLNAEPIVASGAGKLNSVYIIPTK